MSRKVFISVLGTGVYEKSYYVKDNFESSHTRFIQQATLEWLGVKDKWGKDDVALFLLTEEAEKENWYLPNNKRKLRNGNVIDYVGLESVLKGMALPCRIEDIRITEGKNEAQIWENFRIIEDCIQEGDELYFDLTHGFRYLPMLVLVLGSYVRFLKNTVVKSVSYGNYEAKKKRADSTEVNEKFDSPIVDLLPLVSLQQWTYAAGQYLESGNVRALLELGEQYWAPRLRGKQDNGKEALQVKNLVKALERVVVEIQTCRGFFLYEGKAFANLRKAFQIETTALPPLNPLFSIIKDSFQQFEPSPNVKNGFEAVRWCVKNGLYQQAVTLLEESVTSYFCEKYGFSLIEKEERGFVSWILTIEWKDFEQKVSSETLKKRGEVLFADEQINALRESVKDLKKVRNDFNHAAWRDSPMTVKTLKEKAEKYLELFYSALFPIPEES